MRLHSGKHCIPLLVGICLAVCAPCPARASSVKDGAGLFTPGAVARADEQIRELLRVTEQELVIETVSKLPPERAAELRSQGSVKFFPRWAEERASDEGIDGIYVLICREPQYIQVHVGTEAREAFPSGAREELRKLLASRFNNKQYDQGLLDAVGLVRSRLEHKSQPAGSSDWWWVIALIAGFLCAWIAVGVVRRVLGAGNARVGSAGPAAGLLAGMFGATAGLWIYQSLFGERCDSPGAVPDTPATREEPPTVAPSPLPETGEWTAEPTEHDVQEAERPKSP